MLKRDHLYEPGQWFLTSYGWKVKILSQLFTDFGYKYSVENHTENDGVFEEVLTEKTIMKYQKIGIDFN